ncbi:MAG: hypothetical protein V3W09_04120 [Nitrososphaerales archaeon]
MAIISLFDNKERHKGLWISGPRQGTPPSFLRRAKGIHAIKERFVRTRNGTTADASIAAAHSLGRFLTNRFQGATTILNMDGASKITGLDGTRLTMQASAPRFETAKSYYFIAGGGLVRKIEDDVGRTVTQWGIDPPSAVPTAVTQESADTKTQTIEGFQPPDAFPVASKTIVNGKRQTGRFPLFSRITPGLIATSTFAGQFQIPPAALGEGFEDDGTQEEF